MAKKKLSYEEAMGNLEEIVKRLESDNVPLDEAVKLAAEITPEGMSCVMSPAAASYGIFKNFEERGDAFKALVSAL